MSHFDAFTACELAHELAEAIRIETERMSGDAAPLAQIGRVRAEIANEYTAALRPLQEDVGLLRTIPVDQQARLKAAVQEVQAATEDNDAAVRAQLAAIERVLYNMLRAVDDDAQSAAYTEDGELRNRFGANIAFALRELC